MTVTVTTTVTRSRGIYYHLRAVSRTFFRSTWRTVTVTVTVTVYLLCGSIFDARGRVSDAAGARFASLLTVTVTGHGHGHGHGHGVFILSSAAATAWQRQPLNKPLIMCPTHLVCAGRAMNGLILFVYWFCFSKILIVFFFFLRFIGFYYEVRATTSNI